MLIRSVNAGEFRAGITRILSNFSEKSFSATACAFSGDKFKLPQRYAGQGESVWNVFGALADKYKPLNLAHGFPNFPPSCIMTKTLAQVALDKNFMLHQYTRGFGHTKLVNALSNLYGQLTGIKINPMTEILVSCGGYEGLFCSIYGHVDHCDEVIIIEPFFDCYEAMVHSAGGVPRYIALKPCGDAGDAGNWRLDEEELESLFNEKTKAIVINSPNNPLGKVFKRKELEKIASLCKKWDVLCIADDVYEWMIYPGYEHVRMCTLPGMWERTITIGSSGKSFGVTGWKTGWAFGAAKLMKNLFIVHQNCIYTHLTPIQEALARCIEDALPTLKSPDCPLKDIVNQLMPKKKKMQDILIDVGMKPVVPEGGYYMLTDWTPLESKCDLSKYKDKYKDYRFAKWLPENIGVIGIPPSAFYCEEHKHLAENYLRFCFIKTDDLLDKVADTLHKWKTSKH